MKPKYYCLLACFLLTTGSVFAAQTIPVRMYCLSIEADHGVDEYADTMDINFAARPESANELGPFWPFGPGYYDIQLPETFGYLSSVYLYDSYYQKTYSGSIQFTIPMDTDANSNRFPDFFEVSQSANVQTSGGYFLYLSVNSSDSEAGIVTATWTRAAGSYSGTYRWACQNYSGRLPSDWFGTFVGTFKILEYTGTLTYTPGATNVSATINLTQTGVPTNTRQGSITFVKADSDPFNSLTNKPGILMDANSNTYNFTNHYFFRDPNYPTNYAGYVEFDDDGDLTSVYPYAVWVLSINDPNDSNNNGIPDFSDTASGGSTLPRQPLIQMTPTTTNLLFTIHGDINHFHQVQQASSLNSPNWQTVISVTLTNDPQVVPVAFPSGTAFFRVTAQ